MKLVNLEVVATGKAACVRLTAKAKEEWDKLHQGSDGRSTKQKTQLARYVRSFCDESDHRAPDTHYKKEGNFPDGNGGKVAIFVFKPWQWRLYGAVCTVDGKKCFVGTRVDPDKKQDKADAETLKKAASTLGEFEDYKSQDEKGTKKDDKKGRRGKP